MESMRSTQARVAYLRKRTCRSLGILLLGVAFGTAGVLSSCSDAVSAPKTGQMTGFIQASRVKGYDSIRSLAADAKSIVVAVATNQTSPAVVDGVPYTITFVQVRTTLKGQLVTSSRIKIRQLGNTKTRTSDEIDPLLTPGTTYLLFLDVFTFGPGQDTDQFVVVGGSAGLYIVTGQTGTHVRGPDPVPHSFTLGELQTELNTES